MAVVLNLEVITLVIVNSREDLYYLPYIIKA